MDDCDVNLEELEGRLYSQIYHIEMENVQLGELQDPKEDNTDLRKTPSYRYHSDMQTDFSMPPPMEPNPFQINQLNSRKRQLGFTTAFDSLFTKQMSKKAKRDERRNRRLQQKNKKNDNVKNVNLREISIGQRARFTTAFDSLFQSDKRPKEAAHSTNLVEPISHQKTDDVILISDDEVKPEVCQNSSEELASKTEFTQDAGDLNANDQLKETKNEDVEHQESNKILKKTDNEDNDDVIFVEIPKLTITIEDEESQLSPIKNGKNVSNVVRSKNDLEEIELLSIPESNSNDFLESLNSSRISLLPEDLDISTSTHNKSTYLNDNSSVSSISEMEVPSSSFLFNSLKCNSPAKELNLNEFAKFIQCKNYEDSSKAEIIIREKSGTSHVNKSKSNVCDGSDSSSESDYDVTIGAVTASTKTAGDPNCTLGDDCVIIISDDQNAEEKQHNEKPTDTQNVFKFVEDEYSDRDSDYVVDKSEDENNTSIELLNVTFPKELPKIDDKVLPQVLRKNFSDFWTEDMYKFYRESWGQENFNVDHQKRIMTNNPKYWRIISADRSGFVTPKGLRCNHCREYGHKYVRCPQRFEAPKCILCGTAGHFESKCPNQFCGACNRRTPYFTDYCNKCGTRAKKMQCHICSFRGHSSETCTDLWRRYIFTTDEGQLKNPLTTEVKLEKEMWCSYCAQKGHYDFKCRLMYGMKHPPTSTLIYKNRNIYKPIPKPQKDDDVIIMNAVPKNTPKNKTLSNKFITNPNLERICGKNLNVNAQDQLLKLTRGETQSLLSKKGCDFLQKISLETQLKFRLINQIFENDCSYYCVIMGETTLIPNVKLTIKNFCKLIIMIPSKIKKINVLPKAWAHKSLVLYKRIKLAEQKLGFMTNKLHALKCKNEIFKRYCRLNTTLMLKFKMGRSEQHINFLKHWHKKLHTQWQYVEEALKAYEYVFNNDTKFDFQYRRLITTANDMKVNFKKL